MRQELAKEIEKVIQKHFSREFTLHLNRPMLPEGVENEILECINSRDLSTEGQFLERAERTIASYCNAKYALCTITGTSALQLALKTLDLQPGDEVITSPFSFIATANAIHLAGGEAIFLDLDPKHFTLDPDSVRDHIQKNARQETNGSWVNKKTGKRIKAVVPVQIFGHACDMAGFREIVREFNIPVIEDAAQAFGSKLDQKPLGTYGSMGIFSFNGNKIITSGQGGCLVTDDDDLYSRAKLLATNARAGSGSEVKYLEKGFNFRMANINASILGRELEWVDHKIGIRKSYVRDLENALRGSDIEVLGPRSGCTQNHWQTVLRFRNQEEREKFAMELKILGIHYSFPWPLISDQAPYMNNPNDGLKIAKTIISEILLLPSSPDLSFKMLPYFRADLVKKG